MSPDKKRVLILCLSDLRRDPRVYRQIMFLKDSYKVTVAGLGDPNVEGVEYLQIERKTKHSLAQKALQVCRLKARRYDAFYWSRVLIQDAFEQLEGCHFDFIIANDMWTLPLSVRLAQKQDGKLLLDAHEYEPLHFNDRWRFRFLYADYWDFICRKYLPKTHGMTTVCEGIAEEYHKNYGVHCDVITNAPFYENLQPTPVDPDCIRMIHHGYVNTSRRMEFMIDLMDRLDERFTLDFMLVPNPNLEDFKKKAKGHARIRFRDPVPMEQISRSMNVYDIGLFLLWPAAYNYRMALPNKLFEFIQARLAVAIWPSPEMARVVQQVDCGVISNEFTVESMADKLNRLTDKEIQRLKANAHQAAPDLCAQTNREKFFRILKGLSLGTYSAQPKE